MKDEEGNPSCKYQQTKNRLLGFFENYIRNCGPKDIELPLNRERPKRNVIYKQIWMLINCPIRVLKNS